MLGTALAIIFKTASSGIAVPVAHVLRAKITTVLPDSTPTSSHKLPGQGEDSRKPVTEVPAVTAARARCAAAHIGGTSNGSGFTSSPLPTACKLLVQLNRSGLHHRSPALAGRWQSRCQ